MKGQTSVHVHEDQNPIRNPQAQRQLACFLVLMGVTVWSYADDGKHWEEEGVVGRWVVKGKS